MSTDPLLRQLLTFPTVLSAYLSPDRQWVAFNWYRVHENIDVFVVKADGSAPPVALTHTPEATRFVSWTPDSQAVIVAEDHNNDEHVRLFRVDLEHPREMYPLTEDRPACFIRGGDLHPNGRYLFYGANYDYVRREILEVTLIYRHDLVSGERIPIARPARPAYTVPSLNRRGTHLIYPRKDRHPAGRQYYIVDIQGEGDREILNFGDEHKIVARWFPDSEHILVLSESRQGQKQEHHSLGVYHWPSDEMRWLIDDPGRQIENAWITPDGLIVVDEIIQASHYPTWIDLRNGIEERFPIVEGNLLLSGQAKDGDWIGMYYSASQPADLIRLTQDDGKATLTSLTASYHQASRLTEASQSLTLTPAESFQWRSSDGLPIHGWLYRSLPNPQRAILHIHGGPNWHSENKFNPEIQYLIKRGFNVLDVNYRGSTGFGLAFRQAIKESGWGGHEQDDIASGAQALIDAGLAKPGHIGITGTSYGGYCAWFQITHSPLELIAAAAPICGMTDLVVDYETTRPDLRPLSEEMMGGSPQQVPERYFERSPIHFVHNIRGKLLIVQGAVDPNVTAENVRQVRDRLEAEHIPYELLIFEDEGHGIDKPVNQEKLYIKLADFFDKAL